MNVDALIHGMRQWLETQFLPLAELTPIQADERIQAIFAKFRTLAKEIEESTEWHHRGQALMDLMGVVTRDIIEAAVHSEDENVHAAIRATVISFSDRLNELHNLLYAVDAKDFAIVWSFVGLRTILRDSSKAMDVAPDLSPAGDAIRFYRDAVKRNIREAVAAWDRSINLALKFSNDLYFDNAMVSFTEMLHATSRWTKNDQADALRVVRSALKTACDSSILQVNLFIWLLAKKEDPAIAEANGTFELDLVFAQAPELCASLGLKYPFHADLPLINAALARSTSVVREGKISFRGNSSGDSYEQTMSASEFFYTAYYHVIFAGHSLHAYHFAVLEYANNEGRLSPNWERMCTAVPGLAELARIEEMAEETPRSSLTNDQSVRTTLGETASKMHATMPTSEIKGLVDVAIIAVREDEYDAVLLRFPSEQLYPAKNRIYSLSRIALPDGTHSLVACATSIEQGGGHAQDVARDMIEDLDPSLILLVGIAGAVPENEFTLGDVVIAKRVHDFSVTAVIAGSDTQVTNQGGPMHKRVQDILAQLPALRSRLGDWNSLEKIGRSKPTLELENVVTYGGEAWEAKVRDSLRFHFDNRNVLRRPLATSRSVASGNVLIKDPEVLKAWQEHSREIAIVEMELNGVYTAARRSEREYPVLAIRGISDIVGLQRDPAWTQYACDVAASCALAFVLTQLFTLREKVAPASGVPTLTPQRHGDIRKGANAIVAKIHRSGETLTECLVEALEFAQQNEQRDLITFCRNELAGYRTSDEIPEFRRLEGYTSEEPANGSMIGATSGSAMYGILARYPEHFRFTTIALLTSISELERLALQMNSNHLFQYSERSEESLSGKVYFYAEPQALPNLLGKARSALTRLLLTATSSDTP